MKSNNNTSRKNFLRLSLLTGGGLIAGAGVIKTVLSDKNTVEAPVCGLSAANTTVITTGGKVFKVDEKHLTEIKVAPVSNAEARKGIPNKKFVMVIDLAKCDGCKKCTEACQAMHFTEPQREWIKVFKMKEAKETAPYYFPKPCFHCDNPPCTKVCPVNATFKREDGIVLIDNERCIGCRMCMVACPYSTRFFNWSHPELSYASQHTVYSPEQSFPRRMGTVEKCDFCPDMLRQGKMPACVASCPMDVIYMGDQNEDAVTNGSGVTVKLSQLLEDNAAYRHLEELGTDPRVYYLPPKNRKYPTPNMNERGKGEIERTVKSAKADVMKM
jgi:molybdopterin-containing oxidoreductase family iron-sulfur binding subunit